tara:strand:- start:89764 stop:90960 length:1197 start_codon:yes stop_codon:yes gene_type:complete
MSQLVHLVLGDNKFLGYIVDYFETVRPKQNKVVVFGERTNLLEAANLQYADETDWDRLFAEATGCVTHCLLPEQAEVIKRIPKELPLAWIWFGAEYHNFLPEFRHDLFDPETARIVVGLDRARKRAHSRFGDLFLRTLGNVSRPWRMHGRNQLLRRAMRRSDLMGILFDEEFKLVQNRIKTTGLQSPVTYYNIDETVCRDGGQVTQLEKLGTNILLGNSGTPANNHAEMMRFLAGCKADFGKVVVPLSYGDVRYRDHVLDLGQQILGESFAPMTTFMRREEYNAKLSSCGIVIMNHRRQQAVGNIVTALWQGAKVFLRPESTVYQFLTRIGITVFSVERDLLSSGSPKDALTALSDDLVAENRSRLSMLFGKDQVVNRFREMADQLDRLHEIRTQDVK